MWFPAAVVVFASIEIKNDIVNETITILFLHTTHIIRCSYGKNQKKKR